MTTTTRKSRRLGTRRQLASANPETETCIFQEMPLEILDMIFAECLLIDLPNILLTAKFLKNAFNVTRYGSELKQVLQHSPSAFAHIFAQYKRNGGKLPCTIPNILGAFLADNCECGEPAKLLMWFSTMPKKMCESCGKADAPEFQFLKNMSRYYGLVKEDLKDVPTILLFPSEGTIMNHSRSKDESILVECTAIKELAARKQREWKHKGMGFDLGNQGSRLRLGFSEIGYMDPNTRQLFLSIRCAACASASNDWGHVFAYSPSPKEPLILHNYDALREHIVSTHPDALDAFDRGWDRLGKSLQLEFMREGLAETKYSPYALSRTSLPQIFYGWHYFLHEKVKGDLQRDPRTHFNATNRLNDALRIVQEDDGAYFDCPSLPGFTTSIRNEISPQVIKAMMETKFLEVIQEVEELGIAALHKYLPVPQWEGESET